MAITVYYSSVSHGSKFKKELSRIEQLFQAFKIEYSLSDVAADEEAKNYMYSNSPKKELPQIFIDGKYKGQCDDLDEANEFGELKQFLGV